MRKIEFKIFLALVVLVGSLTIICKANTSRLSNANQASPYIDVKYAKACGPIACFAALRALDVKTSMKDVVKKCNWEEGKATTLQNMHNAISSFDRVRSIPTKLPPEKLFDYLKEEQYIAILAIRKFGEKIDHAIVAVGTIDNYIVTIDYPELAQTIDLENLCDMWDGQALLVSRRSLSNAITAKTKVLLISVVAVILCFFAKFNHKNANTNSQKR